ncbi:MAG: cell division protein FtsL [Syntrophomonadaceae bacterium]|nr:cell division protein FtsL [Syntrophomonadaceae bacterium]
MIQAGYDSSRDLEYQPDFQPGSGTQKVRRVSKKFKPRGKILFKIGVIAFIYALLLVYLSVRSAVLGYEIVELQNDINLLETANNRLEYEIAQKTSLKRIEQIAETELGMHKSDNYIAIADATGENGQGQITAEAGISSEEEASADIQKGSDSLRKIYASLLLLAAKNHW